MKKLLKVGLSATIGGLATWAILNVIQDESRLKNDENRIADLEAIMTSSNDSIEDLDHRLDGIGEKLADKLKEIDGRLDAQQVVSDAQTNKYAELETEVTSIEEEITKLQSALQQQAP